MSGLIYFIPNRPAVSEQDVKNLGLQNIFGDSSPPYHAGTGPEGVSGAFTWVRGSIPEGEESAYAHHDEAKQTWLKCAGGKFWIGYWNDRKPGPEQLSRPFRYGGYNVTLGDGNRWCIPVAHLLSGSTTFAVKRTLDENGNWVDGGVEDKFADLCARAARLIQPSEKDDDKLEDEFEDQFIDQLACDAIAANHYVGKWEAALLELMTNLNVDNIMADSILGALVDMPSRLDALKKNAELGNTDGGEED
jgi:hypothetical protein